MKFFISLLLFLSSNKGFAAEVWNTLYLRGSDQCFQSGNPSRQSNVLNPKSWLEYQGNKYLPFTRVGIEKIPLPSCSSALFSGPKAGDIFSISNTAVHFSAAPKPNQTRSWKTLLDYKTQLLGLSSPRMVFDPVEQVVAWVGYHDITEGYTTNYLILFDAKKKFRSDMISVGMGREGLSAVALVSGRQEVLIASADWCAKIQGYDYTGKVIQDFPNINKWFQDNGQCLGWNNIWQWNIDLGYDQTSGYYLLHFSTSNDELAPQPKTGNVYALDINNDKIVRVDPYETR